MYIQYIPAKYETQKHQMKMHTNYPILRKMSISYNDYFSDAPGATARITTRLATIRLAARNVTSTTLPRPAGNFPRTIQYWLSK